MHGAEPQWWRSADRDDAMQDEHGFVWEAIVDQVGRGLAGARVLDAGCNLGGFLRLLHDRVGLAAGYGYDPAAGAIEQARARAGDRPLTFEVADRVPAGWSGFDAAFSHEVLYLVDDLARHGAGVRDALAPGASYYAVMGVHTGSPLMVAWHASARGEIPMPPLRAVDDVIAAFTDLGFEVAASRLAIGFVPATGHTPGFLDFVQYYCDQKLLFRFTRPAGES